MNRHPFELATHPDAHYHHAFKNLPDWAVKASPVTRNALKNARLKLPDWQGTATRQQHQSLKKASEEHWTQRNRLETMFNELQNARDFAERLLSDALKTRFGLELDVKTTFLRLYIPQTIPWFTIKTGAARTWTVSLLDAALHNFEVSETKADAYESDSTFITKPSPSGQFDTLPAIKRQLSIQSFTRLCRELDIGARYEAYLTDHLGLTDPVARSVLKSKIITTHKAAFKSALQMAHVREDLPIDAYRSLLGIAQERQNVEFDGRQLSCHTLTMMSSPLTGIVIFTPELERAQQAMPIIVYIPDDPEHPLKQYPDARAFMTELTRKLRSPTYQTFFSRFVDHQERGYFFADLNRRLSAVTWQQHRHGDPLPSWRNTPIDKPDLRFAVSPIRTGLWPHLYQQQLNKILNDARAIAVSTASADRNARWALWDAFSKVATTILEVAAFVALPFVPLLGELTLAYMAYQLLDETFEGIVDWAEGLQTEAFGHLVGLVESAVQLGTFAAGGAIALGELKPLLPRDAQAFFDKLTPVKTIGGKTRYWKPDLTPYEQSVDLPATTKPDRLGLYRHQGKTLLPIEDRLYAVELNKDTGQFRIQHATRSDAYQPSLRHNGHGAWHTALEQPLNWDRETVLRRLGHSVEYLSSTEREQVLRISGFHDNVLREMHADDLPPPSLLTDCLKRFKIDRDIQAFIEQIGSEQPEQYVKADPTMQRDLLIRFEGWPAATPLPELEAQTPEFRQQAAATARKYRLSLFELRYRALEKTDDQAARQLIDDMPVLPTDIAEELASNAAGNELMQLHNGRVPKRLKDVAQKAMEAVRAARAHEGLYSESLTTADTHRLALHSLESLPGWLEGLRIEIRDYSADGILHDSIGKTDAPLLRTMVRSDEGTYRVEGNSEQASDFYDALLRALPNTQRKGLKLALGEGPSLKQRIAEHTLDHPTLRTLFAKYPQRKPFYDPTTMRLPGGTEGYRHSFGATASLNDRVREVYPSLADDEHQALVLQLQRHPDGPRAELSRLSSELAQLHQDLSAWVNDTPTAHPETRVSLSALDIRVENHNRRLLAQEIQRSWRRQTERDFDTHDDTARYVLKLSQPILGELPTLSADFPHVSLLSLEGSHAMQGVAGFVQRFNGLRRLELKGFSLGTLPEAIPRMTNLDALVLSDCGIEFNAGNWSQLSALNKLVVLDLQRNPFSRVPEFETMPELVHLDLSHTGLNNIPDSILRHAKLDTAKLQGNRISDLSPELFESALYTKRSIDLTGNPLSDNARQLIKHHFSATSYDMGVLAPAVDIDRVRALYPNLEPEQASEFVYELPGTLQDGRNELTRLEAELEQLINDLAAWTADLPPLHPVTGEPFDAQQQLAEHMSRDQFRQTLVQCWRHESELDDLNEALEPSFELRFETYINGELPTLNADFSHVTALELHSADGATRIGHFLKSFFNLKSLRLRACDLGNIPDTVFKMGQLRSLSLPECNISLSPQSASALGGMDQLDYLDLSSNPLGQTPDLSQMPSMANVLLNNTGIAEIPRGLFQLEELDWVDLSENAITEVSSEVQELPPEIAENISLRGNRFSEASLQRLIDYFERTQVDFGVQEVIDQGEIDISTSDNSEVDE